MANRPTNNNSTKPSIYSYNNNMNISGNVGVGPNPSGAGRNTYMPTYSGYRKAPAWTYYLNHGANAGSLYPPTSSRFIGPPNPSNFGYQPSASSSYVFGSQSLTSHGSLHPQTANITNSAVASYNSPDHQSQGYGYMAYEDSLSEQRARASRERETTIQMNREISLLQKKGLKRQWGGGLRKSQEKAAFEEQARAARLSKSSEVVRKQKDFQSKVNTVAPPSTSANELPEQLRIKSPAQANGKASTSSVESKVPFKLKGKAREGTGHSATDDLRDSPQNRICAAGEVRESPKEPHAPGEHIIKIRTVINPARSPEALREEFSRQICEKKAADDQRVLDEKMRVALEAIPHKNPAGLQNPSGEILSERRMEKSAIAENLGEGLVARSVAAQSNYAPDRPPKSIVREATPELQPAISSSYSRPGRGQRRRTKSIRSSTDIQSRVSNLLGSPVLPRNHGLSNQQRHPIQVRRAQMIRSEIKPGREPDYERIGGHPMPSHFSGPRLPTRSRFRSFFVGGTFAFPDEIDQSVWNR